MVNHQRKATKVSEQENTFVSLLNPEQRRVYQQLKKTAIQVERDGCLSIINSAKYLGYRERLALRDSIISRTKDGILCGETREPLEGVMIVCGLKKGHVGSHCLVTGISQHVLHWSTKDGGKGDKKV